MTALPDDAWVGEFPCRGQEAPQSALREVSVRGGATSRRGRRLRLFVVTKLCYTDVTISPCADVRSPNSALFLSNPTAARNTMGKKSARNDAKKLRKKAESKAAKAKSSKKERIAELERRVSALEAAATQPA